MLVRRVKPGNIWHPATDNLEGKDQYGTFVNNGTVDSTFSIAFDVAQVEDFLFITGDREKWLIASVDSVLGPRDGDTGNLLGYSEKRDIKLSSISSKPYQAKWYNRKTSEEDPWISLDDHDISVDDGNIIYGEANFSSASHTKILNSHNGANVYIRKKRKLFLYEMLLISKCRVLLQQSDSRIMLFSDECILVQSIDHGSGIEGKFFNFFVYDVVAYLGNNWTSGTIVMIDQYRDGARVEVDQAVVLWNTTNGGTLGDGHGRYHSSTFTPSAGQWEIGDYFCPSRGNTTNSS